MQAVVGRQLKNVRLKWFTQKTRERTVIIWPGLAVCSLSESYIVGQPDDIFTWPISLTLQ